MKFIRTIGLTLIFSITTLTGFTQTRINPLEMIDVLHYHFFLEVNDQSDLIKGTAKIDLKFLKETSSVLLNLIQKDTDGKGMLVTEVTQDDKIVSFVQSDNLLKITIPKSKEDQLSTFKISYYGIPKDGLIISKNMFGDRTFFGDNWPNRAQNWLPCVDELADKAYVDFYVTAPNYYRVIANGYLAEQTNININNTFYHWRSSVVLPTDVMVVGIARFEVQDLEPVNGIPVSSWVFPQNKEDGFKDYAVADKILPYFIKTIANYPYKKLANVQSKTRFGGMENASNIFYFEKSVNGKQDHEDLLAHEIAHQWFGDSATESDWPHVWLSEGFATYFTNLYLENSYGKKVLDSLLINDRQKIIEFSATWKKPVVDTITTNLIDLLNANSYEKGGWFLHMLRRDLGDAIFFKAIKTYYETYKFSNASTKDFQQLVERVSGKNLQTFFNQWLYQVGQPKLDMNWQFKRNSLKLNIAQVQDFKTIFDFPLSIKIIFKDQTSVIKTFKISHKIELFEMPSIKEIIGVELDPNTNLLFEEGVIAHQ